MRTFKAMLELAAGLMLLAGLFAACQTGEGGSSSAGYYGADFHDPWYSGGPYPPELIVTPPPGPPPPRPEQPIARPLPSIPSAPRPMPAMRR